MTSIKDQFLSAFAEFAAGRHDVLYSILHEDFVEHSPGNPSGRDAFVEFIKNGPVATAKFELERVIADDQHVVVHYRMTGGPGDQAVAVVDIWRFDNGLITEHWDVVQPVAEGSEP
ncbi:nuclear transport factor 2 family protein [Actinoplanes sp. NPDC026619]|uniref:nuclear transport factor 2 family protein n=1 Tax=Actinoplanes sp. NPDC026619 TaxID=3155798 RepID=UPI0033E4660A